MQVPEVFDTAHHFSRRFQQIYVRNIKQEQERGRNKISEMCAFLKYTVIFKKDFCEIPRQGAETADT